jgi:hypothetical protein
MISGMVAGIAGLGLAKQASAAIEMIDERDARSRGFDIIYEARDVDLPQAQRDGLTQVISYLILNERFSSVSARPSPHPERMLVHRLTQVIFSS